MFLFTPRIRLLECYFYKMWKPCNLLAFKTTKMSRLSFYGENILHQISIKSIALNAVKIENEIMRSFMCVINLV